MKILFAHNNFPGQFHRLAVELARTGHEVTFISHYRRSDVAAPGVRWLHVPLPAEEKSPSAPRRKYLSLLATGELFGDAMSGLARAGFEPDLVYGHPGFGCQLYAPDIFPRAAQVGYFEWYYTNRADTAFFSGGKPASLQTRAENRQANMYVLSALKECSLGICPSQWQFMQHPPEYRHKLHVLHEGIDTDFFSPQPQEQESGLTIGDLRLGPDVEIVTYATRGLEPYRGYHTFWRSLPRLFEARPKAHAVIMADDRVSYGRKLENGKGWREIMAKEVEVDPARVHFVPFQSYPVYRELLRASHVHVYLTAPFVLSWSMLEAMSCGCLLVASQTEPVLEVAAHGRNALLTDFWQHEELAKTVAHALENRRELAHLRKAARETILQRYDLKNLLPRHIELLNAAVSLKRAGS